MKMKFAFALFSYFPYGGLQQDLMKILQVCLSREISVTIFCMEWEGEMPESARIKIFPGSGISKESKRESFVADMLEATMGKFDLVLGFNKMPGLDYYFAADYCFAEKAFNERSFLYRITPRARQYLVYEKAVFGKDQQTVALLLSPQQREEFFRHYQTEPERLIQLPPGIKKDRMAGSDAPAIRRRMRYEHAISNDEFLVLQIGSAFKTKGLDRSLLAIAALPDELRKRTRLIVVGEDKPDKYIREAERLGIGRRLRILKGSDEVAELLQAADLLIHPSIKESAGMVILEAIVAGLPVLTTASCGYAFHVEKANAGRVCELPFKQDDLNKQLEQMLLSDERSNWKQNGIRYGREKDLYSIPQTTVNILVQAVRYYSD